MLAAVGRLVQSELEEQGLLDRQPRPGGWGCRAARCLPGAHTSGLACTLFSLYSLRIFTPFTWASAYLPVLSPIYRQAEHWSLEEARVLALSLHVATGLLMLSFIILQFDAPTRCSRPWLHRCAGRAYCSSGLASLTALRWLRPVAGACSSPHADPLMPSFIDAASLAWLCATAFALDAIVRRKDVEAHSRAMLISALLACVPIFQRLLNAFLLAPAAMVRSRRTRHGSLCRG